MAGAARAVARLSCLPWAVGIYAPDVRQQALHRECRSPARPGQLRPLAGRGGKRPRGGKQPSALGHCRRCHVSVRAGPPPQGETLLHRAWYISCNVTLWPQFPSISMCPLYFPLDLRAVYSPFDLYMLHARQETTILSCLFFCLLSLSETAAFSLCVTLSLPASRIQIFFSPYQSNTRKNCGKEPDKDLV